MFRNVHMMSDKTQVCCLVNKFTPGCVGDLQDISSVSDTSVLWFFLAIDLFSKNKSILKLFKH